MGAPKALLRFKGRTFLEHILDAIKRCSIDAVCIVAGRHRAEIEAGMPDVKIVFNSRYEEGMSTSIQAGIRALPAEISGAVLFLVDHPVVAFTTIEKLIEHFRPGAIVVPVYGGRRGHPVLFSADTLQEILTLAPDVGANTVLRRDPGRVIEVAVDDPGILKDIDTPEDFEALLRENSLS
jgi:molybdenum cofactor cytidylyltransferase